MDSAVKLLIKNLMKNKISLLFYSLLITCTFYTPMLKAQEKKGANSTLYQRDDKWIPYLGIMYNYNYTQMEREIRERNRDHRYTGYGAKYDMSEGNSSANFTGGIGKVFKKKVYFGGEIDVYAAPKTEFSVTGDTMKYDMAGSNFSIRPLVSIGARLGLAQFQKFMPYLKVGLDIADIKSKPILASFANVSGHEINGVSAGLYLGVGAEYKMTNSLALRAEYAYSYLQTSNKRYGRDHDYNINQTAFNLHRFKIGVMYYFV